MTNFTITCVCGKHSIKFRSPANYSANIIKRFFCPKCIKDAPLNILTLKVNGVPQHDGSYGIGWDTSVLKSIDPDFDKNQYWYENFFGKRKLIFDFISPQRRGLFTAHSPSILGLDKTKTP